MPSQYIDPFVGLYDPLKLEKGDLLAEMLRMSTLTKEEDKPKVYGKKFIDKPSGEPLNEVVTRYQDYLPIPIKQYPSIDWKLIFSGDGTDIQPLTYLERETGAAILIRTIKRSIHNRTTNHMPPDLLPRKRTYNAQDSYQRFEDALMGFPGPKIIPPPIPAGAMTPDVKDLKQKDSKLKTTAPGSPDMSNMPMPPTPQPEAADRAALKEAADNGGDLKIVDLEAKLSAVKEEMDYQAEPVHDGEKDAFADQDRVAQDCKIEIDAGKEGEGVSKVDDSKDELQAAGKEAGVDIAPAEEDLFKTMERAEKERQERREQLMNEIGLHFWITATTQEEVDDATARLETIIKKAIDEFEEWVDEEDDSDAASTGAVEEEIKIEGGLGKMDVGGSPAENENVIEIDLGAGVDWL